MLYSCLLFLKIHISTFKNFGLYGERVGTLSVVTSSKEETDRVLSQVGDRIFFKVSYIRESAVFESSKFSPALCIQILRCMVLALYPMCSLPPN